MKHDDKKWYFAVSLGLRKGSSPTKLKCIYDTQSRQCVQKGP